MRPYLLDTNVLSEFAKKKPHPPVLERLAQLRESDLFTSVVCVMELRFGAARKGDGKALWKKLGEKILHRVAILPFRTREAVRAGEILADLERRGEMIGVEDILIGATAISHDLTVSTRNTAHLSRIRGLRVENWWQ